MSFTYNGDLRIVQPAAHGTLNRTGNEALRAYQVGGLRSNGPIPNWGLFHMAKMQDFCTLDESFNELPPHYSRDDRDFGSIHCQL